MLRFKQNKLLPGDSSVTAGPNKGGEKSKVIALDTALS